MPKRQTVSWLHWAWAAAARVWQMSQTVREVPGILPGKLHDVDEGSGLCSSFCKILCLTVIHLNISWIAELCRFWCYIDCFLCVRLLITCFLLLLITCFLFFCVYILFFNYLFLSFRLRMNRPTLFPDQML